MLKYTYCKLLLSNENRTKQRYPQDRKKNLKRSDLFFFSLMAINKTDVVMQPCQ